MTEKYRPKKIVAVYDMNEKRMTCPNCHQPMNSANGLHDAGFRCGFDSCRLYGVRYRPVKTLVTMERDGSE